LDAPSRNRIKEQMEIHKLQRIIPRPINRGEEGVYYQTRTGKCKINVHIASEIYRRIYRY
jgi:hypothetical protein